MELYKDFVEIAPLLSPDVIWLDIAVLTAAVFGLAGAVGKAVAFLFTFERPAWLTRWADARTRSLEARLPVAEPGGQEDFRTGLGLARAAPAVIDGLLPQPAPPPATRETTPVAGPVEPEWRLRCPE